MYRKSNTYLVLFAVVALVSLIAGIATAAQVTSSITYQGKLTNAAGSPLTGTYSVTFILYDASTGGTALCTDTHSVTTTNGLFTTPIAVDPAVVDGRALWLGIKVGADAEMTPRQEIRPVPYALGLRPGAVIDGTSAVNAKILSVLSGITSGIGLSVSASGSGSTGISSSGTLIGINSTSPSGIAVEGVTSGGWGVYGVAKDGFGVYGNSPDGKGVFGNGSVYGVVGTSKNIGVRGESLAGIGVNGYSPSGNAIRGESGSGTGVSGIGKEGGYFTTNQAGTDMAETPAVNVSTDHFYNPGITIRTTRPYSDGNKIWTSGLGSNGLSILTQGDSSYGVDVNTTGRNSLGEYVHTSGIYSNGVSVETHGQSSDGMVVRTHGDSSTGVYVESAGPNSKGVSVLAEKDNSQGVYVLSEGANSDGVHAETTGSTSEALYARAYGGTSRGVYASSQQYDGIYTETGRTDNKWGLWTPDYIFAKGTQYPATDVAEYMPVVENATPGTVLIIGDDGRLVPAAAAYDDRVAGIVSTDPGVFLGAKEGGNDGEALIAIAGRVPCRVDATKAPVHAGDLLTTSDNLGHAMKAVPDIVNGHKYYPDGTILGKAMGTLESGTGTIEVLVTLQ